MSKIIVLPGQSLFDIALQVYGAVDGAKKLADDNGINITSDIVPGTELRFDGNMIINKNVVNYYKNDNIIPSSVLIVEIQQGIGFWEIGTGFVVS